MNIIQKYGSEIKFIFLAHVFNPLWLPRVERRRRRGKYSFRKVEKYLGKYLPFIKQQKPALLSAEHQDGPGKIFSIWFQGEENAPELVKVCMSRLRETYPDRYVVLDNNNIREWVNLPDFIWKKWEEGKITHAHFSDICRVALLYQNGGMWFDATDYLTSPVPEWIEEADLFMFLEGGTITPGTFIQSCFMKAKRGNPLMGMWLESILEYWKNEDHLMHYFLLHYMLRLLVENNTEAKRLFEEMPQVNQDPTHVLWYLHEGEIYTDELYKRDTEGSFFQKTTFKGKNSRNPKEGTVAEVLIHRKADNPIR